MNKKLKTKGVTLKELIDRGELPENYHLNYEPTRIGGISCVKHETFPPLKSLK